MILYFFLIAFVALFLSAAHIIWQTERKRSAAILWGEDEREERIRVESLASERLALLTQTASKIPGMPITEYKNLPMTVSCIVKVRDFLIERDAALVDLEQTKTQRDIERREREKAGRDFVAMRDGYESMEARCVALEIDLSSVRATLESVRKDRDAAEATISNLANRGRKMKAKDIAPPVGKAKRRLGETDAQRAKRRGQKRL